MLLIRASKSGRSQKRDIKPQRKEDPAKVMGSNFSQKKKQRFTGLKGEDCGGTEVRTGRQERRANRKDEDQEVRKSHHRKDRSLSQPKVGRLLGIGQKSTTAKQKSPVFRPRKGTQKNSKAEQRLLERQLSGGNLALALPGKPEDDVCELTVNMENEELAEGKRISKRQNVKYVQRERSTSKKRYASPGAEIVERVSPGESGKLGSSPRTVTNKIMIETSKNGEENKNTFSINMNLHMNSNNSMPLNPTTNQTNTTIRAAPSSLENAKKIIS